jgi:hypothetical protein
MAWTASSIKRSEQPRTVAPRSPAQMIRAVSPRWRSVARLRGPSWASGCLRVKNLRQSERTARFAPSPYRGNHACHHDRAKVDRVGQAVDNDEVALRLRTKLGHAPWLISPLISTTRTTRSVGNDSAPVSKPRTIMARSGRSTGSVAQRRHRTAGGRRYPSVRRSRCARPPRPRLRLPGPGRSTPNVAAASSILLASAWCGSGAIQSPPPGIRSQVLASLLLLVLTTRDNGGLISPAATSKIARATAAFPSQR